MSKNKYASIAERKASLESPDKLRDPPEFVEFDKEGMAVWKSLMRCRQYSDWSQADLLTAVKIVRKELVIRRGFEQLETWRRDGADELDPDSVASEYAANLEKTIKLQLTALRSIGVTRTAIQVKGARKHVEERGEAEAAMESFKLTGGGSMLAVN